MAVLIGEADASAMYLGDAVMHEVNLRHLDWTSRLETDRVAAVETRRRLLDRAASAGSTVAAFHLATTGGIEATEGWYRFTERA